jgi:GNAT superfamily N-acetyltransferase
MRANEFVSEISDEQLQRYLARAGRQVDARQERMARVRDRLNKGYEIYHAETPNRIVHRFDANTPAEAKRYYDDFITKYESDVDYDLRLRRATGIMEDTEDYAGMQLRLSKDSDGVAVRALAGGRELGMAEFFFDEQGRLDPQTVWVDERYHGQGIATAMYDYLKDKGYTIIRSWDQTDAGRGFWDKHRGEEATVWEGKYNANPATYNLPRRSLNVPELIKRGAIFITEPHGPNGWEPDAEGFSLVTLYNVMKGGWPAEAKQHLKPSMYKVATKALNQQGQGTMMYDGKYNQILWSIKKLGIPEEVAFLDSVEENFADGKVKGKSRPGRVKRAGASCKGSVTDLRAKARKYGGEKGKMYHWCANMKAGKKK